MFKVGNVSTLLLTDFGILHLYQQNGEGVTHLMMVQLQK